MSGTSFFPLRSLRLCGVFLLPCLALVGCQKARPYTPRLTPVKNDKPAKPEPRGKVETPAPPKPLSPDIAWMDSGRNPERKDIRIEFVHQGTQPEEWKKLKFFWNDPGLARIGAVTLPGLKGTGAVVAQSLPVRIKVPLGLDDPTSYIPLTNPPTRGKWELGKRLFFDPTWLTAKGKQSCASCHDPKLGFASDDRGIRGINVPTLMNVVFNTRQFWDGRARFLEETVQMTLEDEREPVKPEPFRHVWHGVIGRLRKDESFKSHFNRVFGTLPTQDNVGKSLATYMRTLLAANSLYDRADAARRAKGVARLTASHFEAVLDAASLKALGKGNAKKSDVASELLVGHDLYRGRAACAVCHPLNNGHFSDSRFHNIGVEGNDLDHPFARLGRFSTARLGEKTRTLRGAWKTPTLRGLSLTAPYMHNGEEETLRGALRAHLHGLPNRFLSPHLMSELGVRKNFGLSSADIDTLELFVKSLDGEPVDPFISRSGR